MATVRPIRQEMAAVPWRSGPQARPFLGDLLVGSGALRPEALEAALARQRDQDAPLGRILLVEGRISNDALVEALSRQARLGRIDLAAEPPDPELALGADPRTCLRLDAIPWRRRGGRKVVAIANPAQGAAVIEAFAGDREPVALAIAPAEAIREAIASQFGRRMVETAEQRCPSDLSCRDLFGGGLTRRKALAFVAAGAALTLAPLLVLTAALVLALGANLATTVLRLFALFARFRGGAPQTETEAPAIASWRRRPSVSLLVPLKGEAAMAAQILGVLGRMDYPAPLLDIKLVLEAEDVATREALLAAGLPPTVDIVTVPRGSIQTKPRALNYALPFCRGEIVGVYDAEDLPDPGQIRAVVHHFSNAPEDVACVQGYLDFYNERDGWLARCFTIEYAVWFRIVLHGIQRLGLPIPLGGTTLFFRRAVLERIGCWDAHNVTEDADLGMRLARFGYRCEMLPTTTREEANASSVARWIGQRSRWLKGYAATWAVHMRRPATLWRELGPAGFLGFQILLLGGVTAYFAAPLLWLFWPLAFGVELPVLSGAPAWLLWFAITSLVVGKAVELATAAVALIDSRRPGLLPWIAVLPAYAALGSVAAWRAVGELVFAPFHWQKTEHGRSRGTAGRHKVQTP